MNIQKALYHVLFSILMICKYAKNCAFIVNQAAPLKG